MSKPHRALQSTSKSLLAVHSRSGRVLGNRIWCASTFFTRLRGLLGRRSLARGEGLLLRPCRGVHTYGLGFPLDVAFLRVDGKVEAVYSALSPGQRTAWHREATAALELPSGTLALAGVNPGDQLVLITATNPVKVPA